MLKMQQETSFFGHLTAHVTLATTLVTSIVLGGLDLKKWTYMWFLMHFILRRETHVRKSHFFKLISYESE